MGALKRALERQAGVRDLEFDLDTGVATLAFEEKQKMSLGAIEEATSSAGFELKWVDLSVTGVLVELSGQKGEELLAVRVEGTAQAIILIPGDTEMTQQNYVRLQGLLKEVGQKVQVQGRALSGQAGFPEMAVEKLEAIP